MHDKIKNIDAFELLKLLNDKSIDLVITDPPYWHKKSPGLPYNQRVMYNTLSKYANSKLFRADGLMMKEMSDFTDKDVYRLMSELSRVMKVMNAYIFCNDTLVPYYCMWAENNKYLFSILVWEKPLSIINKNRFSQNIEYIVRIYDYGTALNKRDENYFYNKVKKYDLPHNKIHPTQKPLSLIREILLLSSQKDEVVLDPFMGSGTTAIACIKEDRDFLGSELSKDFYDVAIQRIKNEVAQTKLF